MSSFIAFHPVLACECGDHVWTPSTRGYVILVSFEDREQLEARKWNAAVRGGAVYAEARVEGELQYLHRWITPTYRLTAPVVDHINGNGMDCRRPNLRCCSKTENSYNKRGAGGASLFKGVFRNASGINPWSAQVRHVGKTVTVGSFATEEDAARAYDDAAIKAHGRFARLNFPQDHADLNVFCSDCNNVHSDSREPEKPWRWRCVKFPRPSGYGFVHPRFSPTPPYMSCRDVNTDGRCGYFTPIRQAEAQP